MPLGNISASPVTGMAASKTYALVLSHSHPIPRGGHARPSFLSRAVVCELWQLEGLVDMSRRGQEDPREGRTTS